MAMIRVRYPDHHRFDIVYDWCKQNCKGRFYSGTDWRTNFWKPMEKNRIVEFEHEQDAILFSLQWT